MEFLRGLDEQERRRQPPGRRHNEYGGGSSSQDSGAANSQSQEHSSPDRSQDEAQSIVQEDEPEVSVLCCWVAYEPHNDARVIGNANVLRHRGLRWP